MHFVTADSDETQRVGLWLLKGGPTMADGLLHVCLCPKKLRNAGIILHINLAKPAEVIYIYTCVCVCVCVCVIVCVKSARDAGRTSQCI